MLIKKAHVLFSSAASAGHARAMMNLATMLEKGDGVVEDKPQALTWYQRAHQSGDQSALLKSQRLQSFIASQSEPKPQAGAAAAAAQRPDNAVPNPNVAQAAPKLQQL